MTWPNRLKLLFGLIVVLGVVAGCTVVFTQRQNSEQSVSATITAESFAVGALYAGTVVDQLVQPGDTVTAGEPLLVVRSPQLVRDLDDEAIDPSELDGVDAAAGTYQIVATVDGVVDTIDTPLGDFVSGGGVAATIDRAGTSTVSAEFVLTPRDYGRVATGAAAALLLPDDDTIPGVVSKIEVETVDGQAKATLTITSDTLTAHASDALFQPGTPVRASLQLRDDGPLAGAGDALRDFLHRLGL